MSFILEALIQAQLERQCHGVPGLYTVQVLPRPRPQGRRRWPAVATGVVGLTVLATIGWLQPWNRDAADHLPSFATSTSVATGDSRLAKPEVISLENREAIPAAPVQQLVPDKPEASVAAAKPGEPRRKHRRRSHKAKVAWPAAKVAAVPGGRIYSITELPAELQKVARSISIAGYAHSDNPKERTAIINNRAIREGEEVSGGLRVERIAGDGVIFSLKGYRFRKGRT